MMIQYFDMTLLHVYTNMESTNKLYFVYQNSKEQVNSLERLESNEILEASVA